MSFAAVDADDRPHRDLAVVVGDPHRHAAEERERPHVPFPEALGALAWHAHHEERVAVGQGHQEDRHLLQGAAQLGQGVEVVHLGLARPVDQRHEHLAAGAPDLRDRLLHDRAAAAVALLPQSLEDPLGGVPLLLRDLLVLLQDHPDPVHVGPQLGLIA